MTAPRTPDRCRTTGHGGYSYVEVLIAIALISVALVPATNALRSGIAGAEVQESLVEQHFAMFGRLEDVLAEPFASLDAESQAVGDPTVPTSYSDPVSTPHRALVYLSRYDADNADADGDPFTGVDPDLVWIRVEIEGSLLSVESLKTRT